MDENISVILILIVVAILFFLAIREVICWYYKINKQIKIQQAMLETMLKIFEQNGGDVNWWIHFNVSIIPFSNTDNPLNLMFCPA